MPKSSTAARKGKAGRPSEMMFVPKKLCEQATKLLLLGLNDERTADLMGISANTFYRWQKEHPEFREAVLAGKEKADAEVAHGLYHRAIGYSHPEEKIFYDSKAGEIVRAETTKHYPPDTGAAVMWLKNRQRDHWKDIKASELSGPNGGPISTEIIPVKQLEPEDRAKLRAFLEQHVTDVEDLNEEAEDGESAEVEE